MIGENAECSNLENIVLFSDLKTCLMEIDDEYSGTQAAMSKLLDKCKTKWSEICALSVETLFAVYLFKLVQEAKVVLPQSAAEFN